MVAVGPYDMWVIEYGYTFEKDLKKILARVAEPELIYGTDEDTIGPDPRARRYDFSKHPLDYAKEQIELADHHRGKLLENFVKEGDSWSKARRGYEMTLRLQTRSVSMMANWVGGLYAYRDKKGDPNGRKPLEVVSAEEQRSALQFVIDKGFQDEAYGLTPDLLNHLTQDLWLDEGFGRSPEWPVHDRIMGVQSSILTALMNPDTLTQVYDNELRTPEETDMLTLPELLDTVGNSIWSELDKKPETKSTARKPWISSLRRNLQREHVNRLIDLLLPGNGSGAAYKPISNLVFVRLKQITDKIDSALEASDKLDAYSQAHLSETKTRIAKALDAQYIYNTNDIGGGGGTRFILLGDGEIN
jgi:hypothetical protein